MQRMAFMSALLSASAIGVAATAAERQTGRIMRGPDHPYQHQDFPSWRYGPNGQSVIVNSEDETPAGFVDHPAKVKDAAAAAPEGTKTAIAPTNGTTSAEKAAKTTGAVSRAATDVAKAAKAGVGGAGTTATTGQKPAGTTDETNPKADPSTIELDADGHAYDPKLHAATKSKTNAGLWRMKVGVARPAPVKLDL